MTTEDDLIPFEEMTITELLLERVEIQHEINSMNQNLLFSNIAPGTKPSSLPPKKRDWLHRALTAKRHKIAELEEVNVLIKQKSKEYEEKRQLRFEKVFYEQAKIHVPKPILQLLIDNAKQSVDAELPLQNKKELLSGVKAV